jgi:hypothetical protein
MQSERQAVIIIWAVDDVKIPLGAHWLSVLAVLGEIRHYAADLNVEVSGNA